MARVIVIDDDEIVAEIACEALTKAGHFVSAVYDGDEAVDMILRSDPNVVILDYNLPGKTGMQILREVRSLTHTGNMAVLMLTARGGRLHMAQAEQTGADDYMVKPFMPDELVRRVEALLVGSSISTAVSNKPGQTPDVL